MSEVDQLRERVAAFEAVFHQDDAHVRLKFDLAPHLANLLGALLSAPRLTEEMVQNLNIATDGSVAIHRLRKQLEPYGITISSRRKTGWWLDDDNKRRVLDVLTSKVTEDGNGA